MERKLTREVKIGSLKMGGTNPVVIQSMCNTDTRDVEATVAQILALEKAGCELVRVAIPDMAAADAVGEIQKRIHIPLVADIHFDYRLALRVMELGIDKVRINPGNIGDEARIKQVVDMAKEKQIPIRIGVNSGSLEKELVEKYGGVTPQGLVESALKHVHILEKFGFYDIVVSIKASDVRREGFEPPAFWSVGCLKHKSEPFRLRFVLFTAARSADLPLFPSRPARSNSILGQNWVREKFEITKQKLSSVCPI